MEDGMDFRATMEDGGWKMEDGMDFRATMEDGGWKMALPFVQLFDLPQKSSARAIILFSIVPVLCQAASICLNSSAER
jgi:hypothetical protein